MLNSDYKQTSRFGSIRRGLSMLEVLSVIIIIAVLVGLLLPAVQSSRETARRHSCDNNLRQIWLGTEAYRCTYKVYPSGTMAELLPVQNFPADNHQGWLLRVAPLMSGGAVVLQGFDYSRSVYDPVNWPIVAERPQWLVCASSPDVMRDVPVSHYVGVYDGRDVPIDQSCRGAMVANQFLTNDDFYDGLANTAIFSETSTTISALGWTSGSISTLRSLGIPAVHPTVNWNSSPPVSTSMKYGWCAGDRAQSYEEFIDAMFDLLLRSGSLPSVNKNDTESLKAMTIDQKVELIRTSVDEEAMYLGLIEDITAPSDSDSASGVEEEVDFEYGMGMGGFGDDYDEPTIGFPLPLIGSSRFSAAGVGSYHTSGFNLIFVDGHSRVINWEFDQKVLSTLGIRDDGLPLMLKQ